MQEQIPKRTLFPNFVIFFQLSYCKENVANLEFVIVDKIKMLTVKSVDHHDVPIDEFNSNCQVLCLEEDVAVIFNCCVYSQRKFKGKKSYGVIVFFF